MKITRKSHEEQLEFHNLGWKDVFEYEDDSNDIHLCMKVYSDEYNYVNLNNGELGLLSSDEMVTWFKNIELVIR